MTAMVRLLAVWCFLAAGQTCECRRQRKIILSASPEIEPKDTLSALQTNEHVKIELAQDEALPGNLKKIVPSFIRIAGFPEWINVALVLIPSGVTLFLIFVLIVLLIGIKTTKVASTQDSGGPIAVSEGEEVLPSPMTLLGKLMSIAIPTAIGNTLFMVNEMANMIILGHVGTTDQIAAVGLGNTMQNCFGLIIGLGLCTGLDPLCSQAIGAGDEKMASSYLQRCRCVVSLQLIWMVPFLFFSEPLLVMIGQNPEVAANAGHYNKISCFGLFCFFNMFAMMSWLRSRGKNSVPVLLWACVVCLHVPSCFLWVAVLGLGNAGCGIANLISWTLGCVLVHWYGYTVARDSNLPVKSVLWIEADGLRGWGEFCSISVPAMLQSCTEMWYFEVVTFVTGYLGQLQLASWVSAYTVYGMLNMPSLGISTAASVVVGFAIGEKKPKTAKALIVTSIIFVYVLGCVLAALLIIVRYPVCWIFNDIPEVHALMSNILILMAITGVSDYAQCTMAGILRGVFRPGITVIGFIVSFWIISMPLGLTLGFPMDLGVYGLGFANCIGSTLAALFFGCALMLLDVDAIVITMGERMEQDKLRMQPAENMADRLEQEKGRLPAVTVLPRGRSSIVMSM